LVGVRSSINPIPNYGTEVVSLLDKTGNRLNQSGFIQAYGGTSAPSGWLICDGASYLRSSYSTLFAIIGTAYGSADGTHFNVPDLRGRFARGVDGGAGNDPDAATRIASATGGNTGDNLGSLQEDELKSHTHVTPIPTMSYQSGGNTNGLRGDGANPYNQTSNPTGGNETRPKNVYVNYIIKI
jgi:microcystin-dependent protein